MDDGSVGFIMGVFLTALILTQCVSNSDNLRKQAIEKGFAEYSQTTGKWQWKEGESK